MRYDAGQDPLCYPGTSVLINTADLHTQDQLDEFEAAMFRMRSAEPWPVGALGVAYYRALHQHLFQDVYSWAGQFRTIRIGKGGNWFCYPEYIAAEMARIFDWAGEKAWFTEHSAAQFAQDTAFFLAYLNAIHPFREGNGRTQLAFLSVMCDAAGYGFDDDALEPNRVIEAMIASFNGEHDPLKALIAHLIGHSG